MRTLSLLILTACLTLTASAQNIQLHYDFTEDREYFTSTVELFKPDAYGTTFFFIDFNYDANDVEGVSESYFELARAIKISEDVPFDLHLEYNGGQGQFSTPDGNQAYTISDAYLAGIEKTWLAEDFSWGVTAQVMYKYIRAIEQDSFQLTLVWFCTLLDGKVTFNGFADFWGEDVDFDFDGEVDDEYTFLAEPQLWYNLTPHWAVGSEVEFGYNFAGNEGWDVFPTVAVKTTF
jgi:hypothetical protein